MLDLCISFFYFTCDAIELRVLYYVLYSNTFMPICRTKAYVIVIFPETGQCEAIPTVWLIDRHHCRFPLRMSQQKCDTAVRERVLPGADWSEFEISLIASSKTYSGAQSKRQSYIDDPQSFLDVSTAPSDVENGKRKSK